MWKIISSKRLAALYSTNESLDKIVNGNISYITSLKAMIEEKDNSIKNLKEELEKRPAELPEQTKLLLKAIKAFEMRGEGIFRIEIINPDDVFLRNPGR